jgi:hypothetical protein
MKYCSELGEKNHGISKNTNAENQNTHIHTHTHHVRVVSRKVVRSGIKLSMNIYIYNI